MPFAEEGVHGFSTQADDKARSPRPATCPSSCRKAFYSESYSVLFQGEGRLLRALCSPCQQRRPGGAGGAAARAVLVGPNGKTIEDAKAFESGQWRVLPEGAIEMARTPFTWGPTPATRELRRESW